MKNMIKLSFVVPAIVTAVCAFTADSTSPSDTGREYMAKKFSETQARQAKESEELKKTLASKSPEEKVKAVNELWNKQHAERRAFVRKQREDAINRIKNSDATEDIKSQLSEECKKHWDRVEVNLQKTDNDSKADYYNLFDIKMIPDDNKPSVDKTFSDKMVQESKREDSKKKMETQQTEHKDYYDTIEKKHKQMESIPKQDIKFDMSK